MTWQAWAMVAAAGVSVLAALVSVVFAVMAGRAVDQDERDRRRGR